MNLPDLSRPCVMGVLNVTPDSFSDGGRHATLDAAVARGVAMVEEGAAIVDVGGESMRPGARPVEPDEERRRVLPVIEALARRLPGIPLSIDTRRAVVAREALAAGASIVNDVAALDDEGMAQVVARTGAALVLMHHRGTPETMASLAVYDDVLAEVEAYLAARLEAAVAAGIPRERLLVDPGLCFAKTPAHNWTLLGGLDRLARLGPLVVGASRKSFLGALGGGRPPADRLAAGLGVAAAAVLAGARVIRTHDVRETVDAVLAAAAIVAARAAGKESACSASS